VEEEEEEEERRCVRCRKSFFMLKSGAYASYETCSYHWGKLRYTNTFSPIFVRLQLGKKREFRKIEHIVFFVIYLKKLEMHRKLIWPDIRPSGYPDNPKAGYRISGRISGGGRISDIRPDFML
jgi:hypothetical protein